MHQIRLKSEEIQIIKEAVALHDPAAVVYLFGSRANPAKKGGDIDLLVFSEVLKKIDTLKILKTIFAKMEEQKIDIVITNDEKDPFVQLILNERVKL